MNTALGLAASEIESIAATLNENMHVALAYDGSIEGMLSCIFVAFACQAHVEDIIEGAQAQPRLGQTLVAVPSSMEAATRVQNALVRTTGHESWYAVFTAAASNNAAKGTLIYKFVQYALRASHASNCATCPKKQNCHTSCSRIQYNKHILLQLAHPAVEPIVRMQQQANNEIEKMRQFMRFSQVEGNLWFATCNPSCNVVPFVMPWFGKRFNTQRFAIYDEVHHIAGVSENGTWQLVATSELEPPPATTEEALMQHAWRKFYHALSINERYNPELRRNFMPMRLWKNIIEMQPELRAPQAPAPIQEHLEETDLLKRRALNLENIPQSQTRLFH